MNIFEREAFQAEVEKLKTAASKADTIAHRTQKTITEKMDEDPVFYRRFPEILQETIAAYRAEANQRRGIPEPGHGGHELGVEPDRRQLPPALKSATWQRRFTAW